MKNLLIVFNPEKEDFDILIKSLKDNGFHNGNVLEFQISQITKSFEESKFIVLYYNDMAIGFTTWDVALQCVYIEYKWIIPKYRGVGFGRKFSELIYEEFKNNSYIYIVTEPATKSGHGMAEAFGFKPLCATDYAYDPKLYYLFLYKGRPQTNISNSGYELLIWSDYNKNNEPSQIYKIDNSMDKNPIITIVNGDGQLELRNNGKVLKKDKCKYFFNDSEFQYYGLLYFRTNLFDLLKRLGY